MRRLAIAIVIALLPISAFGQQGGALTAKTDAEKKRDAEIEKAYKDTMKRTNVNAPQTPTDPWQTVRQPPTTSDSTKR